MYNLKVSTRHGLMAICHNILTITIGGYAIK